MHQCIKFILFWKDTLHVSAERTSVIRSFKTVHTATGVCQTDSAFWLLVGYEMELVPSV